MGYGNVSNQAAAATHLLRKGPPARGAVKTAVNRKMPPRAPMGPKKAGPGVPPKAYSL